MSSNAVSCPTRAGGKYLKSLLGLILCVRGIIHLGM